VQTWGLVTESQLPAQARLEFDTGFATDKMLESLETSCTGVATATPVLSWGVAVKICVLPKFKDTLFPGVSKMRAGMGVGVTFVALLPLHAVKLQIRPSTATLSAAALNLPIHPPLLHATLSICAGQASRPALRIHVKTASVEADHFFSKLSRLAGVSEAEPAGEIPNERILRGEGS
jgi:hypothetical protein